MLELKLPISFVQGTCIITYSKTRMYAHSTPYEMAAGQMEKKPSRVESSQISSNRVESSRGTRTESQGSEGKGREKKIVHEKRRQQTLPPETSNTVAT